MKFLLWNVCTLHGYDEFHRQIDVFLRQSVGGRMTG